MRTLAIRCLIVSFLTLTAASMVGCDEERPERLRPGGPGPGGGTGSNTPGGDVASDADAADGVDAPVSFVADGVAASCAATVRELDELGAPAVQSGSTALFAVYEQVGDNQNPLVLRFDDDVLTWCARHESEPPDGRAVGLTWEGGPWAWVVYTVVGGGTALETAAADGWLPAYAPGLLAGGGAKVSVIGRVDVETGSLDAASFVIAVESDGSVNSHSPSTAPATRANGDVVFRGESAHKPVDFDGRQSMLCSDYPFDTEYVFSSDLSTLRCASSTNCQSQRPCP